MFLIDSLLLAPLKGVIWMGQKLKDVADHELYDEGRIKEELLALHMQLELGQIGEEEYDGREKEILDRLDAVTESTEKEM